MEFWFLRNSQFWLDWTPKMTSWRAFSLRSNAPKINKSVRCDFRYKKIAIATLKSYTNRYNHGALYGNAKERLDTFGNKQLLNITACYCYCITDHCYHLGIKITTQNDTKFMTPKSWWILIRYGTKEIKYLDSTRKLARKYIINL